MPKNTSTSPETAVVKFAPAPVAIDAARLELIGKTLAPDLTADELRLFGEVAVRSGLDPFAKQIFAIKRKGRVKFQTSIDGQRSIAARTGEYDGQDEPEYAPACDCGQPPKGHPLSATVRVYRKGMSRGVAATAFWHEYKPDDNDFMWAKMPHVMLAKVAEALALRKAFPYIMADLYTAEEMEQANSPAVAIPSRSGGEEANQPAGLATGESSHDSPEPAGDLEWQGKVSKPIDKVREVKAPAWYDQVPEGSQVAKAELAFTIDRRKHTAILFGDLAFAAFDLGILEGEEVRTDGDLVEIEWQEGKPKKKELHFVTTIEVYRDGGWLAPERAQQAFDMAGAAEAEFRDIIDYTKLPAAEGEGDIDAELAIVDQEWRTSARGNQFVLIRLTDQEKLYSAMMAEDEAREQLEEEGGSWRYSEGEKVRIVGGWHNTSQGPVVLLTAVTTP